MPITSAATLLGVPAVNYRQMLPDDTFALPDCFIGVEMELENDILGEAMRRINVAKAGIRAVRDGSLRNGGVELLFDGPLLGSAAVAALRNMFEMKRACALVGSIRTSTHVHINYAEDTDSLSTISNSILLWLLIEKAACVTCGPHREYNNFCVPSYMLPPEHEQLLYQAAVCYGETLSSPAINAIAALGHLDRYMALNTTALWKYGTLEYRSLGTADYNVTICWINLLLGIKRAAKSNTLSALLAHDTLDTLIERVLPEAKEILHIDEAGRQHYKEARHGLLAIRSKFVKEQCDVSDPYDEEPADYTSEDDGDDSMVEDDGTECSTISNTASEELA